MRSNPQRAAIAGGLVAFILTSGWVSWATTPDGNLVVTVVPGVVAGLIVYGLVRWLR